MNSMEPPFTKGLFTKMEEIRRLSDCLSDIHQDLNDIHISTENVEVELSFEGREPMNEREFDHISETRFLIEEIKCKVFGPDYYSDAYSEYSIDELPPVEWLRCLSNRLYKDTLFSSDPNDTLEHPNFIKIKKNMTEEMIPLLLFDMKYNSYFHWIAILKEFTDDKPSEHGDTTRDHIDKWLEWGKNNGYI